MSTGIISKVIGEEIAAGGRSALRSMWEEFGQSQIGKSTREFLVNKWEPEYARGMKLGREYIESIFHSVSPSEYSNLTKSVMGQAKPISQAVANGVAKLKPVYDNAVTMGKHFKEIPKEGTESGKWTRWQDKVTSEVMQRRYFGENKELFSNIVKTATDEGGVIHGDYVNDNLSLYFHQPELSYPYKWKETARELVEKGYGSDVAKKISIQSPYVPVKETEQAIRRVAGQAFLGRIFAPHLSQYAVNGVAQQGIRRTIWALGSYLADREIGMDLLKHSGSLERELRYEQIANITRQGGLLSRLGYYTSHPGFNMVRREQMGASAVFGKQSAEYWARNILRKGVTNENKIELKSLGIDAENVFKNGGRLTQDEIDKAVYKSVNNIMFIRSEMTTPPVWHHTWVGRMTTMYKDYSFTEGNMLARAFKKEYDARGTIGVIKKVAELGVIMPVTGEAIVSLERLITGQNPLTRDYYKGQQREELSIGQMLQEHPFEEYFDAIGHVAGWGIGYSLVRSAKRYALLKAIAGPVPSTLTDLAADVFTGNVHQFGRHAGRLIPVVGPAVTNVLLPPKKKKKSEVYY